MSQNLISLSRREPAIAIAPRRGAASKSNAAAEPIALLDETVYAMIDHRRLSGTIASDMGLQTQDEPKDDDSPIR